MSQSTNSNLPEDNIEKRRQIENEIPGGRILGLPQYAHYEVLVQTHPDDFPQLCRANRELIELCSGYLSDATVLAYGSNITERLYYDRSKRWFDSKLLKAKSESMSWREFYIRLNNFVENISDFIEQIDEIATLENYEENITEIKLLSLLNPPIIPRDYGITQLVTRNYELLSWFDSLGIKPKTGWWAQTDDDVFKEALQYGDIQVINWFLEKGYKPDITNGIDYIVLYRPLEIAEFMKSKGYLPSSDAVRRALENANEERLSWLTSNNITLDPNIKKEIIANNALFGSNIKLEKIKWLIQRGYYPTIDGVNSAAAYGNLEILKYLKTKGFLPNSRGATYALRNQKTDVVRWLASQNPPILPN